VTVEILLAVFVGATALAIVIEAIAVRRTLQSTDAAARRLTTLSVNLETDAKELLGRVQDIVGDLDHLRGVFEGLGNRLSDVSRMMEDRSKDLDALVRKVVEVGNRQADKVDEVVSDTTAKFRQTTDLIERDIMQPIVEIASLIKGVRAGLGYFISGFKGGRGIPDVEYSDDEMFI